MGGRGGARAGGGGGGESGGGRGERGGGGGGPGGRGGGGGRWSGRGWGMRARAAGGGKKADRGEEDAGDGVFAHVWMDLSYEGGSSFEGRWRRVGGASDSAAGPVLTGPDREGHSGMPPAARRSSSISSSQPQKGRRFPAPWSRVPRLRSRPAPRA